MKLKGKVALITGAASGIGKATAMLFAKEGAKVVVVDIGNKGKDVVEVIQETYGNSLFVKCDVSKISEVKEMAEKVISRYNRIDILLNNAGIYQRVSIEDMDEEVWNRILNTNLKGPFLCSKYVIPIMKRQKNGAIVNIASDLGLSPEAESPAYCASKAGLIALTKSMALAYKKYNIRTNAICPGPIDTPMLRDTFPTKHEIENYVKSLAAGRLGKPEEVANVALFLASDDASYVNGATYVVNGADVV